MLKTWIILAFVGITAAQKNFTLLLVQAVWRHGDRSPTKTFPKDVYQEDYWTFGGSGWGQLSPKGMQQHMVLGQNIRSRYCGDQATVQKNFLSPTYNSHEIYIRSTDVNRTVISAMSNIIGMYGQEGYGSQAGLDLPPAQNDTEGFLTMKNRPVWPANFIPVAVHTVDDDTDYILNPDATCPRQDQLWDLAKLSPQLVAFQNQPNVTFVLSNLTSNCGENVTIDNLWVIVDDLFIQQIHVGEDTMMKNWPWYSNDYYVEMKGINDQVEAFQNGVYDTPVIAYGSKGQLDIGIELQKIRGGSLTNDLLFHMQRKLNCQGNSKEECTWTNRNKYYAYSAHDTTVYAFFSCLGIQSEVVQPHGYPLYSAATLIELYQDEAGAPWFQLWYRNATNYPTSEFELITHWIAGCENKAYCELSYFEAKAKIVKPDMDMNQWCKVDPKVQIGLSDPPSFAPTSSTSSASSSTTPKTPSSTAKTPTTTTSTTLINTFTADEKRDGKDCSGIFILASMFLLFILPLLSTATEVKNAYIDRYVEISMEITTLMNDFYNETTEQELHDLSKNLTLHEENFKRFLSTIESFIETKSDSFQKAFTDRFLSPKLLERIEKRLTSINGYYLTKKQLQQFRDILSEKISKGAKKEEIIEATVAKFSQEISEEKARRSMEYFLKDLRILFKQDGKRFESTDPQLAAFVRDEL